MSPPDTQTADYLSRVGFGMILDGGPPVFYLLRDAVTTSTVTLTAVNAISSGFERLYSGELNRLEFSAGGYLFRESPTLTSPGETSLSDTPNPGLTAAASFFDVFFEISSDGGTSWVAADQSVHLEATVNIPEPGTMGLLLVGLGALFMCNRRRRA